jgi:sulfur carrier protein ThiS
MRVEVHFHAELTRLAPDRGGVVTLDMPSGARVADVLGQLSLNAGQRLIVGVNGEAVPPDQELSDGARIDLLTPMAGGSPARSNICRTVTGTASSTSI